jgi:hypothetical protein
MSSVDDELQRVLTAQVPRTSGRWTPLPGFQFSINAPDELHDEFGKYFARVICGLYANAAHAILDKSVAEHQFVFLLRVQSGPGKLTASSYVHLQALIDFAENWLPPKGNAQRLSEMLEASPLRITHRCVVLQHTWAPVVAVYRPAEQSVLLTNENQVTAPGQFLEPAKCRTTPGFLNFLGTLMIKSEQAGDESLVLQFDDVSNLLGKGIDPWIRWLYHAMETTSVFDSDRIYVNADDPDAYDFRYGDA